MLVPVTKFDILLKYTIDLLPETLSVYSWLDLRVKYAQSNMPFEPCKCFVDCWPCPNVIICISQFQLNEKSTDSYAFICMWSSASSTSINYEKSSNLLWETLEEMKIDNGTFCGLDKQLGDCLVEKYGSKIHCYKADQFWIKPSIGQQLMNIEGS